MLVATVLVACVAFGEAIIPNFDAEVADMAKYTLPMKLSTIEQQQQAPQPVAQISLIETSSSVKTPEVPEIAEQVVDKETDNVMAALDNIEMQDALAIEQEEHQKSESVNENDNSETVSIFLEDEVSIEKAGNIGGQGPNGPVGSAGGDLLTVEKDANPSYWLPGAWGSNPQPPLANMYYTPSAHATPDSPLYVTNPFYAPSPQVTSALPPITSAHGATFDTNPATLNMEGIDTIKWTQANSVSPLTATVPGQPQGNYVVPAWIEESSQSKHIDERDIRVGTKFTDKSKSGRLIVPSLQTTYVRDDKQSLAETVFTDKKTGVTIRNIEGREKIPVYSNFNGAQGATALYTAAELKGKSNENDQFGVKNMSEQEQKLLLFASKDSAKVPTEWAPSMGHVPRGLAKAVASDSGNELRQVARGPLNKIKADIAYMYNPEKQYNDAVVLAEQGSSAVAQAPVGSVEVHESLDEQKKALTRAKAWDDVDMSGENDDDGDASDE